MRRLRDADRATRELHARSLVGVFASLADRHLEWADTRAVTPVDRRRVAVVLVEVGEADQHVDRLVDVALGVVRVGLGCVLGRVDRDLPVVATGGAVLVGDAQLDRVRARRRIGVRPAHHASTAFAGDQSGLDGAVAPIDRRRVGVGRAGVLEPHVVEVDGGVGCQVTSGVHLWCGVRDDRSELATVREAALIGDAHLADELTGLVVHVVGGDRELAGDAARRHDTFGAVGAVTPVHHRRLVVVGAVDHRHDDAVRVDGVTGDRIGAPELAPLSLLELERRRGRRDRHLERVLRRVEEGDVRRWEGVLALGLVVLELFDPVDPDGKRVRLVVDLDEVRVGIASVLRRVPAPRLPLVGTDEDVGVGTGRHRRERWHPVRAVVATGVLWTLTFGRVVGRVVRLGEVDQLAHLPPDRLTDEVECRQRIGVEPRAEVLVVVARIVGQGLGVVRPSDTVELAVRRGLDVGGERVVRFGVVVGIEAEQQADGVVVTGREDREDHRHSSVAVDAEFVTGVGDDVLRRVADGTNGVAVRVDRRPVTDGRHADTTAEQSVHVDVAEIVGVHQRSVGVDIDPLPGVAERGVLGVGRVAEPASAHRHGLALDGVFVDVGHDVDVGLVLGGVRVLGDGEGVDRLTPVDGELEHVAGVATSVCPVDDVEFDLCADGDARARSRDARDRDRRRDRLVDLPVAVVVDTVAGHLGSVGVDQLAEHAQMRGIVTVGSGSRHVAVVVGVGGAGLDQIQAPGRCLSVGDDDLDRVGHETIARRRVVERGAGPGFDTVDEPGVRERVTIGVGSRRIEAGGFARGADERRRRIVDIGRTVAARFDHEQLGRDAGFLEEAVLGAHEQRGRHHGVPGHRPGHGFAGRVVELTVSVEVPLDERTGRDHSAQGHVVTGTHGTRRRDRDR